VTLHRPSHIDSDGYLLSIMEILTDVCRNIPVIFSVHPHTRKQLVKLGFTDKFGIDGRMKLIEPLGYHDFISIVDKSRFVLTDSGGLQEETTFMGIPCLTLRPNTERPITVIQGTNKLTSLPMLKNDIDLVLCGNFKNNCVPDLWDGSAGNRIVGIFLQYADDSWSVEVGCGYIAR
jgi:UDP-N-acetylglucosamine 2-epimerase (non-hydrolysing)